MASAKRPSGLTDEQHASQLFNRLARLLKGKPGDVAMTAAVNLVVGGAKGVGITQDKLIETIRETWERTDTPRRRG